MPRQREDIYGLGPEDRLRALGDNRDRAKAGVRGRSPRQLSSFSHFKPYDE